MICKTAALISLGYLIIATLFCRKANRERGEIVVDPNPQKTELVELQSFFNPAQQEEIVCRLEKKIKARLNSNA